MTSVTEPAADLTTAAADLRELAASFSASSSSVSDEELDLIKRVQALARARRQAAASKWVACPLDGEAATEAEPVFSVSRMNFTYSGQTEAVLQDANFTVFPGQRILLVGVNGAGKSTLLRTVCGHHIAEWEKFEVAGVDSGTSVPWCDQFRGLAYLGGNWKQQSGFTGPEPYSRDIRAGDMMKTWQDQFVERRDTLVRVLGINLDWRMHRVSDGQRKKVRTMLKLLRPFKLAVIDEFVVELDIFARKRFMDYLARECHERGAAVVYATHIFDQADDWSTHIMFVKADRSLSPVHDLAVFEPYQSLVRAGAQCPMYRLVLEWMLASQPGADQIEGGDINEKEPAPKRAWNYSDSGYESGRSGFRRREDGEKSYLGAK